MGDIHRHKSGECLRSENANQTNKQ